MQAFKDYDEHDGVGLAELVAKGDVQPGELVEAAIARVEERNPAINAVIRPMFEQARQAAAGELPAGPLRGVPMVLKDLNAAWAGEPLSYGCRFLKDYVPDFDSEMVKRIKKAGLVVVGKSNAPELGILGVTEPVLWGACRNPWNLKHTPGGSSGGSGAAVGAGIVPIGHAGDGGGSIRIPASCCGLFGLKQTRGRMPTGPHMGESWSGFDQDGFITRSVRDTAALLDACHGPDLGAPYVAPPLDEPFCQAIAREPRKLRIAFTARSLLGQTTHGDNISAVEDAARLCEELGHEVIEGAPTYDKEVLVRAYLTVVASNVAQGIDNAARLVGRRAKSSRFEPETWLLGLIGNKLSARELVASLEARHLQWRSIAAFFQEVDVFLTPTMAYPPQRIGEGKLKTSERLQLAFLRTFPSKALLKTALEQLASDAVEKTANTMMFNMTGQPAMNVPLYWSSSGLPIGVQFAGRFGDEATLLQLAAQLEQARPWAARRPPSP